MPGLYEINIICGRSTSAAVRAMVFWAASGKTLTDRQLKVSLTTVYGVRSITLVGSDVISSNSRGKVPGAM